MQQSLRLKGWELLMRKYNLPIFIPHRGCPHDCVFCNQRKITGVETDVTPGKVKELISGFLRTLDKDDASVEVAFFGGSFTGLEMDLQEEFLSIAKGFFPQIDGIRLSTRPDYINDDVIKLLKKYGVTTVELGVQSTNDEVLALNNRGHSFADVKRASQLIKNAQIELGHQIMLGMYGSDPDIDRRTVEDVIKLKPSCMRIYPVITLKGTHLEKLYNEGKYIPYTIETAAELAKDAIVKFRERGIEVIRVGLHSSDELENGDSVVAGPYHAAFGEITESLIFRDEIEKEIKEHDAKVFVFKCAKNNVSKAIGHRKMNKIYFKDKYGVELKVLSI